MAKTKRQRLAEQAKRRLPKISKIIYPIVKTASAPVAFIDQISAKDRQILGSNYDNAGTVQKMKILTNIILGRTAGINPFSSEYKAPQTINPSRILNKWTNAGGLMIVYSVLGNAMNKKVLGSNVLPATNQVKQIGKSLLIGGGLGGFFDDSISSNPHQKSTGTRQIAYSNSSMSTSSSDSSASGF